MQLTYQSEYSNQVHQLIVSVSKHLFATKTGRLKSQQKPMEVKLAACSSADKEQVVHYLIRDHYSGVFYAEIHPGSALIPLEDFLYRAWSQKEEYLFCGAPDWMSIPRTVSEGFPAIIDFIGTYDIKSFKVTSGFQSGAIRDIKTWEQHIRMEIRVGEGLESLQAWTPAVSRQVSADLNANYSGAQHKIQKWDGGIVKAIRLPPEGGWYQQSPECGE